MIHIHVCVLICLSSTKIESSKGLRLAGIEMSRNSFQFVTKIRTVCPKEGGGGERQENSLSPHPSGQQVTLSPLLYERGTSHRFATGFVFQPTSHVADLTEV